MRAPSYLDASAIVKLAVREAETDALETYIVSRETLFSSRLSAAEVYRAVGRTESTRGSERAKEALRALYLLDVTADVLHHAGTVGPAELRTSDAIHLVTALANADPELQFVTYDNRLAKAASAAGLRVVQPGRDARAVAPSNPDARIDRKR
jgi:uncharacterized protein